MADSEHVIPRSGLDLPAPKVVEFRSGPLVNDIPGMLRKLADDIEARRDGHELTDSVTVLVPRAGDYPIVFGFGDMHGLRDPLIVCEMAKVWLVLNCVERR